MNAEDLPSECANGCGFYGNRATRNMCSRCYRDFLKKSTLETQVNLSHTVNKLTSASHADDVTTSLKTTDVTATAAVTKTTNWCVTCTKRVGLTGFKCRCGGMFCGSHRHPEAHSCGFDHKKLALEALSKTLYSATECKGAKLD